MEPWIPPVISGAFSLAVVGLGALFIGLRERKQRAEDQDRADKNNQRQAVASYIRADRSLSSKLLEDSNAIDPNPDARTLSTEKVAALLTIRAMYFNELIQELEILDLHIHDYFVRQSFNGLNKIIRERRKQFEVDGENIPCMSNEQQIDAIERLVIYGIVNDELKAARSHLIETARVRLRLKPGGSEEHPGIFTSLEDQLPVQQPPEP